jgi:peptidoglycan biosynthesis protein MviN/MurJ (putative lipid II flippase)
MSDQEKTLILSKILGYERVPVDIETFIMDDYYLGQSMRDSLYPFWLDELKKIFVSPVLTKYPYISLGGAIGVGKSTVSKIMTLYMLHRLDCLSNPWKTLGVAKTKSLAVVFQHTTAATAYKEFGKSIEVLRILLVAMVFAYAGHLVGFTLIAKGRQKAVLIVGIISLLVNIIGNLILIPSWGVNGAAWITALTEMVAMGLMGVVLVLR